MHIYIFLTCELCIGNSEDMFKKFHMSGNDFSKICNKIKNSKKGCGDI